MFHFNLLPDRNVYWILQQIVISGRSSLEGTAGGGGGGDSLTPHRDESKIADDLRCFISLEGKLVQVSCLYKRIHESCVHVL